MKTKSALRSFLLAAPVTALVLTVSAHAAVILQPTGMIASSTASSYTATQAVNKSGFDSGTYTTGVTDFDTALSTLKHSMNVGNSVGWASAFNPTLSNDPKAVGNGGVMTIDMGAVVSVSRIGIWMFLNGNPPSGQTVFDSTKDFQVYSSDNATLASATLTSLGVFTLPDTNTARTGLAFDITDATSRYFVINVRNLHTDTNPAGNDHASFGEIAFEAVPEPSAALLGGIGMLCLLRRRR